MWIRKCNEWITDQVRTSKFVAGPLSNSCGLAYGKTARRVLIIILSTQLMLFGIAIMLLCSTITATLFPENSLSNLNNIRIGIVVTNIIIFPFSLQGTYRELSFYWNNWRRDYYGSGTAHTVWIFLCTSKWYPITRNRSRGCTKFWKHFTSIAYLPLYSYAHLDWCYSHFVKLCINARVTGVTVNKYSPRKSTSQ